MQDTMTTPSQPWIHDVAAQGATALLSHPPAPSLVLRRAAVAAMALAGAGIAPQRQLSPAFDPPR